MNGSPPHGPLPQELPLGLRPAAQENGFSARIWAPRAEHVAIVVGDAEASYPLEAQGLGTWTATLAGVAHGEHYWVELDGERWADPWSRWQPSGTTGPSALVDPAAIGALPTGTPPDPAAVATDPTGRRPARPVHRLTDAVIYELHVGTFTEAGDFDGVADRLGHLAELGITHIELMPVAEFPGRRNWGYDGIFWSAADSSYGGPARLVALVDAAHRAGLGVVLDVVYNHVGPTGDPIYDAYGPFFTDRHQTPWGRAVNVDGPGSDAVRQTVWQSARWWVGEVGADGIRVDACHAVVDQGARHVLAELSGRVHDAHPDALVIAESGLNDPKVVRPRARGGWGFDADWSDDFHHALRTLVTEDCQGWYGDFGRVGDLAKAFHRPLVHDGTWSPYRGRRFGAPADDVAPEHFVVFDQDHDQVGNRPLGDRLPRPVRPVAALVTLFSASTPMLFMGEEHGEDAPFLFFSDHQDQLIADATRNGRRREFADFTAATGEDIPDPQAVDTFRSSRLTWKADPEIVALYRRLLTWRRRLPRVPVVTAFDEEQRWLRVERGPAVLVANFAASPIPVPCPPGTVEVATHPHATEPATSPEGHLVLPPCGGALVWQRDSQP